MIEGLAPHFFQVAYVVPDLLAAEAWFQRSMGIKYFQRMEHIELGATTRHRGRPGNATISIALGYLGEVQIELVQPVRGDSIHAEFLAAGHRGLHHVAFLVPDFGATMSALRAERHEPVADGVLDTGMRVEFAYFDWATPGASVVEILGFDAAARAAMDAIKARCA